jgi:NAD(P)H-nitrite reductase large subunit
MHIVIVGNGIAGITCARFVRKMSDHEITVISSETDYFYARTALMYIYMGDLTYENTKPYEDWFWEKNRINLVRAFVQDVDADGKYVWLDNDEKIHYDKLVLATGSKSNKFGWPVQDLHGVQGFYSLQDLQLMEQTTKEINRAVIVGGGLIGIELAEMLHSRDIPITMIVREEVYWGNVFPQEEGKMVADKIREHGIALRLQTEITEILGDENKRARAVKTTDGDEVPCQWVGLAVGVHPNLYLAEKAGVETQKGILIDRHFQTSYPAIYAAGDCAQFRDPLPGRPPVEQVWYTGRIQGETLAHNLVDDPVEYNPGVWFNSAKFLDIEYQVYGTITSTPKEGVKSLLTQDKERDKLIRIDYDEETGQVIGFDLLGVRYRHHVCDKWLKEGAHIRDVLQNIKAANFDPEFRNSYEHDLVRQFNEQNPGQEIELKPKRKLWQKIFG